MGDHLRADIGQIRDSGNTVKAISNQFKNASDFVNAYDGDLGSGELEGALHEFATNWEHHRDRLCEDLDKFSDWAIKAADAYTKSDQELAKVLTEGAEE